MKREALPQDAVKYGDERAAIRRSFLVAEFALDGTLLDANEQFLEAFGYELNELKGTHHAALLPPEERNSQSYIQFWQVLRAGVYQNAQFRRVSKTGQDIWIQASYSPILDTNGRTYKIVKIATDITEQKVRDADFQGQINAIRRSLLVIEFALDGTVLDANQNFLDIFGYRLDEIKNSPHSIFVKDSEIFSPDYTDFWAHLKAGSYQAKQFQRVAKDGHDVWIQATYSPIFDPAGRPYKIVKYATDISLQRQLDSERESKIQYSAHHDLLTGLHNRLGMKAYLAEELQKVTQKKEWFSVVLIDLDGFKAVNDNYGHAIGDALLKDVGERMLGLLRQGDFVARLGGDEFAVVVKQNSRKATSAISIADRLLSLLRKPFRIQDRTIQISASIGISIGSKQESNVDTLIDNADAALYNVKENGRNGIKVFDDALHAATDQRRELEMLLASAVGSPQMYLDFQPIVSTATGQLQGMEALCRWNHPEKGNISPAIFIPLAERTGLIARLGKWVMRDAILAAAQWPDTLFVSINVSPKQLGNRGFVDDLADILLETKIDPGRVELEVTETVLLEKDEAILADLFRLKTMNVKISLDDFGTGFSSLSYLKMFPFNKIKIDRSFVSDLADNRESSAIVFASTLLAQQLGISVTAEGIETKEQFDLIRKAGCDLGQGYFFGAKWDGTLHYSQTTSEIPFA